MTKAVRHSDLPSASRLIMLTLADSAETGTAEIPPHFTPSLKVLAKETGLGRSTVAAHLSALERDGWVVRIRPTTAEALGRLERTRYQLRIPVGVPSPTPDVVPDVDYPDVEPSAGEGLASAGAGPPSPAPGKPSAGDGPPSAGAGHRSRSSSDLDQINVRSTTSSPRKRGSRLPDDFAVTDAMRTWARENVPALAGRGETEKFVDYWRAQPGQRGVKLDWEATWRNWMRRAAERAPGNALAVRNGNGHKPSTTDQRVNQALALAAKYAEQEAS